MTRKMRKCTVAVLAILVAAAASVANARDDEPSPEAIDEFASNYMRQFSQQKMSLRETANQLASSIWWSEKVQLLCPSYFYVNARRAHPPVNTCDGGAPAWHYANRDDRNGSQIHGRGNAAGDRVGREGLGRTVRGRDRQGR